MLALIEALSCAFGHGNKKGEYTLYLMPNLPILPDGNEDDGNGKCAGSRCTEVAPDVFRCVILFNHFVVPRLRQKLLGTEAFGFFRQAMYGARDS